MGRSAFVLASMLALTPLAASGQTSGAVASRDYFVPAVDPGIRLFVREKMAPGNRTFTDDNIVVFLHGATYPSLPDFDFRFKDYSWADWMVGHGYVVYMLDYRNYGGSTREAAMDKPAKESRPLTRSYLAIRDIGAVVDDIRAKRHVNKVTLIGWSWGAMLGGYYTSLHSEKVKKLVMYAPAYALPVHTNLGPGSASQDRRHPYDFNYALGGYRTNTAAQNQGRWDGEIPVEDKSAYREPGVLEELLKEDLATDPTSATRTPPALRAPNGVLEDTFYQSTGRRMYNASSIYVPTLVIGGDYDTWSYQEDRELLMRDLTNAPVKKNVVIKGATHFVIYERKRLELFNSVLDFLKE